MRTLVLARIDHEGDMVADLLREEGFSLQACARTIEGEQHPDRDAQFHYINERARQHMDTDQPVISVDTGGSNGCPTRPRFLCVITDSAARPERRRTAAGGRQAADVTQGGCLFP